MWGINLNTIKELFGDTLTNHLIKYSRKFIVCGQLQEVNNRITLTEQGIMLSDYIIRNLMYLP